MKKQIISLTALVGFALGASLAYGGVTAGSGIVGSKHDMRQVTRGGFSAGAETRVCAYCHTPHHSLGTNDVASVNGYYPLWSHVISTETFTPYKSITWNSQGEKTTDPMKGPSRLCMSCHDGAVGLDQYYGNNPNGGTAISEGDTFGSIDVGLMGNMANDHPMGFEWTALDRTTYPEIRLGAFNPTTQTSGSGTTAKAKITSLDSVMFKDPNNASVSIFTCASCHDVHNGPNVVENAFLYEQQKDSMFCTMCHIK
jgi:hypothetical protein